MDDEREFDPYDPVGHVCRECTQCVLTVMLDGQEALVCVEQDGQTCLHEVLGSDEACDGFELERRWA